MERAGGVLRGMGHDSMPHNRRRRGGAEKNDDRRKRGSVLDGAFHRIHIESNGRVEEERRPGSGRAMSKGWRRALRTSKKERRNEALCQVPPILK